MEAIANCSGPAQTKVHDFCEPPDIPQVVEPPMPQNIGETLPTRGEDTLYIVWWLMCSEDSPIHESMVSLTQEMQVSDRQDMRQDVALRLWQTSQSAQLKGYSGSIHWRAVLTECHRWLLRAGKLEKPAKPCEDAVEAAKLLRDEARLALMEQQHMREASRVRAEHAAKNPPAALVFKW